MWRIGNAAILLLVVFVLGCDTGAKMASGKRVKDDSESDEPVAAATKTPSEVATTPAAPPPSPNVAAPPPASSSPGSAPPAPANQPAANVVAAAPTTSVGPPDPGRRAVLDNPSDQAPLPPPGSVRILFNFPPNAPAAELTEQAAMRMKRIVLALDAYSSKHRNYPPAVIASKDGTPLYSWRVELLPYLGYEELYERFDRTRPWNDPKNKALLAEIPLEYQAPHRRVDGKTIYMAASGEGCAFEKNVIVDRDCVGDGFERSVLIVEVDDSFSQPWTSPVEFECLKPLNTSPIGKRGNGSFLAGFGDGTIRRIETSIEAEVAKALFTIAGGEDVAPEKVTHPWKYVVPKPEKPTEVADEESPPSDESAAGEPSEDGMPRDSDHALAQRFAAPTKDEVDAAKKQLKEIYKDDIAQATTPAKQGEVARKMLDDAEQYKADGPAYYALLSAARDMGTRSGEYMIGSEATTKLTETFRIDGLQERRKLIEAIGDKTRKEHLEVFCKETEELVEKAIWADNYETATLAADAFVKGTRRKFAKERPKSGPRETAKKSAKSDDPATLEIRRATQIQEETTERKRAFEKVAAAKENLRNEVNLPQANLDLGEYLCLYKGDWNGGMRFLARSADVKLKLVAGIDTSTPADGQQMLDLGDLYWELAEKRDKLPKTWLMMRAVYWYTQAMRSPATLARARAEKRIQQCQTTHGEPTVAKYLKTMSQAPTNTGRLAAVRPSE